MEWENSEQGCFGFMDLIRMSRQPGEGSVPFPWIPLEATANLDKELKPPISIRERIYKKEPEGPAVSHMSMCFVSSVTKENVPELTSSSCIHQVFTPF